MSSVKTVVVIKKPNPKIPAKRNTRWDVLSYSDSIFLCEKKNLDDHFKEDI